MNIRDTKDCLPALLKHDIVPFFWGNQGIGKTSIIKQFTKANNLGFVHLHLATQEVGDLVGLLKHNDSGTVEHSRPEWFPTEGSGIIFLDEFNRAHPDVLQAMFPFTISKTIHRHTLPPGWKIIAAGNYQSGGAGFNVTDMSDAALLSRFCHIDLKPTVEEFVAYAESRGAVTIAAFIMEHPKLLETSAAGTYEPATPDRRAWLDLLAPLEQEDLDDSVRFELYTGIVGATAAASLKVWKSSAERRVRIADILKDYPKVKARITLAIKDKETRFDLLGAPLEELEGKLKDNPNLLDEKKLANLKLFFLDLPLELVSQAAKSLSKLKFKGKDSLLNDPAFIKALVK
jgi:MoxR-like ATPase